jgi:non-heme chloroperoxidase
VRTDFKFATIRLASGPRLHYAEHGAPDGAPVVFLHGWPDSWFSFSRVVSLLPGWLHAFVPDQRGFGESDRLDGGYGIEEFADDVVAFLDAVSIERATIVGHSFGSFVTRRVAITNPQRVDRIVLIGTGVSAVSPATREVQADMVSLEDPVPVEFARSFQAGTAYAPLPDAFFERLIVESMKLPARLWRKIFDGVLAYDDAEQLTRISAPTLLLWGERDVLFSKADQDRLVDSIKGARLKIYKDTGHCPNWERPELVAADLKEFLQQH